MTDSVQKKVSRQPIEITDSIATKSFYLLRFIGYVILVFSVIDYAGIFIPPRLTDPTWEFQAITQMVEQVWSPLLGLTFIFLYNQSSNISSRQLLILRFLSWVALFIGIAYLLVLPLGVNNSLTLYKDINSQFTNQQAQQQEKLQKFNTKLNSVNSPQELENLARSLNIQNEAGANQSPQELKSKIQNQLQNITQNQIAAANTAKTQQVKSLIKNAVKVNLGAIISGVCFITFWRLTRWTRVISNNV
jgi:hypothetical protein